MVFRKYTSIRMQEQVNVRDVLRQAFQALNNKEDRSRYFDLHDDSLITHGIPGNFPDKEGMRKYYSEVWRAFPDANFACMFSMTSTQRAEFLGIPPSDKQVRVDGMIFFSFKEPKIVEMGINRHTLHCKTVRCQATALGN